MNYHPHTYKVQAQGTALPSYTEVIQENRSQELFWVWFNWK